MSARYLINLRLNRAELVLSPRGYARMLLRVGSGKIYIFGFIKLGLSHIMFS